MSNALLNQEDCFANPSTLPEVFPFLHLSAGDQAFCLLECWFVCHLLWSVYWSRINTENVLCNLFLIFYPHTCDTLYREITSILLHVSTVLEPPGDPTVESCRKYALEGDSVTCECEARFHDDKPPDFSLTWPGYSNIPSLQLSGVRRSNNGSVFTCLMIWNGHRRTANYTLQVACKYSVR